MATAAQRWLNRRRLLELDQIQAIYNNNDLVIILSDVSCGVKKGDVGYIVEPVFPRGTSYRVTFQGEHIFQGKYTASVPIEKLSLR